MRNFTSTIIKALLVFFTFFFVQQTFADDILIPFGQNNAGAPQWKYKGGGSNYDAVNWKDLGYAETGWLTGGAAFGFGTNPPAARNTAIPEDASAGGGGIAGARYTTMYFRKVLTIASLNSYANFLLRAKFDDGIVVWINGVEAFRNNIDDDPVYATFATAAMTNNGVDIFSSTINTSLFVNGDNIIAVEIHQNQVASSDLFFDMELTGVVSANDLLMAFGQNSAGAPQWKYKGGGSNYDGTNWKDIGFAETGWLTGGTAFGFGTNPPAVRNTAIPEDASAGGGGIANARYPTMYFRKIVNIPVPGSYIYIQLRAKFDDGIVVWINGTEAFRNNINANPAYATFANAAMTNNGADIYTAALNTSLFLPGNNIIAVEVHQNQAGSSDLYFDMELTGMNSIITNLTRGPYLQMGNDTAITVRWRTDVPSNSKLKCGISQGIYTDSVTDAALTTEHEMRIKGLLPDTRYFYAIGSSNAVLQQGVDNYFVTAPPAGSSRKLRFVAIGDCGNNSTNQVSVKNTFLNYAGGNNIDAMILLGDNAYDKGLDNEYQTNFFDIYKNDLLKNIKLYPAPGNHDYANTQNDASVRDNPYYNSFTVPIAGECGGVASGTEAFYSFNIGDVHFVSLDSYGKENSNSTRIYDTTGAQITWLKNDLAANTKKWTVVYFHHPPYTKTSHDSDTDPELTPIRERVTPILERYGVDLILCGHAHGYERSYLLKGFTIDESLFNKDIHTPGGDTLNALYNGTNNSCPYTYQSGINNHGSVYVVSGSAGQIGGMQGDYPHNAMRYSNSVNGGCFYFEVDSNRLDAKFISYTTAPTPVIRDQFTIFKDVNKVTNLTVSQNAPVSLAASWRGAYTWPNNGNTTTRSVTPSTATVGAYSYIVKDNYSCIKDSFRITVTAVSPTIQLCAPVAGTTLSSNLVGANYQWQVNTGNGFVDITNNANYSGSNSNLLQLTAIPSSWNGYQYRCVVNGSNSTVFDLQFFNSWLGTVNTEWENPANWSCNQLPDENTDVLINTGTAVLNSNTAIKSITVNPNANFTITADHTLLTK